MTILLIGGSSHAGKSTLAARLAQARGCACRSTDKLARHPGRPWRPVGEEVPPHVVEHFGTLSTDELIASVMDHYRKTVWPLAKAVIRDHVQRGEDLVLEGSALWPADVAALGLAQVSAIWLTAEPDLFRRRMLMESGHADRDATGRRLIETFLDRTLAFDALLMAEVGRLGLRLLEVRDGQDPLPAVQTLLG